MYVQLLDCGKYPTYKILISYFAQSATITYKAGEDGQSVKYCSVTTSLDHNPGPETVLVRESLAPRTIVKVPAATAWETVR